MHTVRVTIVAGLAALILTPTPAGAQHVSACRGEASALAGQVRAAVARYEDVDEAIAQGYSRVGHDFPAMGEHWISLREAARDQFDPARPQILLYMNAQGSRRLVGAAFTAVQDPGEPMPGPPYLHGAWHEHSGTLDDELFAAEHATSSAQDRLRVLVLHVWTRWVVSGYEFDVENWSLPFRRAGLVPPPSADIALVRAVSLAASANYYITVLHHGGVPGTDPDRKRLNMLVNTRAETVRRMLAAHADAPWTQPEMAALRAEWQGLMDDVAAHWPATASHVAALHSPPHAGLCS